MHGVTEITTTTSLRDGMLFYYVGEGLQETRSNSDDNDIKNYLLQSLLTHSIRKTRCHWFCHHPKTP